MIIGFVGRMGSGKDTAGAFLVEHYGFKRVAFADKVKECLAALLGCEVSVIENAKNDPDARIWFDSRLGTNYVLTVRGALQRLGTEVGRKLLDGDIWVDTVFKNIDPTQDYVFTDVRFQNEVNIINEYNGFCIRINRFSQEYDSHKSEDIDSLTGIKFNINNNGSIQEFHSILENYIP